MTYFELYKHLQHKPYRYNPYFNRLEDYSVLPQHLGFTRHIDIPLVSTNRCIEFYGTRDIQAFFSNRFYLRNQLTLAEAKLKYPEFFI